MNSLEISDLMTFALVVPVGVATSVVVLSACLCRMV